MLSQVRKEICLAINVASAETEAQQQQRFTRYHPACAARHTPLQLSNITATHYPAIILVVTSVKTPRIPAETPNPGARVSRPHAISAVPTPLPPRSMSLGMGLGFPGPNLPCTQ